MEKEKIVQITAQTGIMGESYPCIIALTDKGNMWQGMWLNNEFKWDYLPLPNFNDDGTEY